MKSARNCKQRSNYNYTKHKILEIIPIKHIRKYLRLFRSKRKGISNTTTCCHSKMNSSEKTQLDRDG